MQAGMRLYIDRMPLEKERNRIFFNRGDSLFSCETAYFWGLPLMGGYGGFDWDKPGEDVFTVAELFDKLTPAIFKELSSLQQGSFSTQKPAITLLRRNLQDYYFLMLAEYTIGDLGRWYMLPESCQSIPKQQLVGLSSEIQSVLNGKAKLDAASKAHLMNLDERIKKVLNSQLQQSSL